MELFHAVFHIDIFIQPQNMHARILATLEFLIFFFRYRHSIVCIAHSRTAPIVFYTQFKPLLEVHIDIIHTMSATSGENP